MSGTLECAGASRSLKLAQCADKRPGVCAVFGRVAKGMDVVHSIEKVKTDKMDKPLQDVKILNISVEF